MTLHSIIEMLLPHMISILEVVGILVVFWSGIYGFWQYFQNTFMKKSYALKSNLAKGMAMGLEFKMAAEILKTVLVQDLDELYVLGAVILLRALLSLLIHFELKHSEEDGEKSNEDKKDTPNKEERK